MTTQELSEHHDLRAPDGSEIRLVGATADGSMVHCTLQVGGCTTAVRHRTVHEIWLVVDGRGELWRRDPGGAQHVTALAPRAVVDLPVGTGFQFRSLSPDPLTIVIMTTPAWPGAEEAVVVEGRWPPTVVG